jgi:NADH-quinone oxidoreductase subunit A
MPDMLGYLLVFTGVGAGFVLVNLMAGKLIRPAKMDAEKATVYECGEPTIGSAWVQFDLRFYVVALLFVIFDVEIAFFFPWAVIFGRANDLADPGLSVDQRAALIAPLQRVDADGPPRTVEQIRQTLETQRLRTDESIVAGSRLAWVAFFDILFFFGVLLVGFAYLWKRGDLNWVRSTAAQKAVERGLDLARRPREELVMLTKD